MFFSCHDQEEKDSVVKQTKTEAYWSCVRFHNDFRYDQHLLRTDHFSDKELCYTRKTTDRHDKIEWFKKNIKRAGIWWNGTITKKTYTFKHLEVKTRSSQSGPVKNKNFFVLKYEQKSKSRCVPYRISKKNFGITVLSPDYQLMVVFFVLLLFHFAKSPSSFIRSIHEVTYKKTRNTHKLKNQCPTTAPSQTKSINRVKFLKNELNDDFDCIRIAYVSISG